MPAYYISNKLKLMCGSHKIRKGLCAQRVIYSSGSICTYHVDTGVSYQEEVDSDASCLTPKTFTPQKTGWSFVGWREDAAANATVLTSKVMKDDPITLYAVFRQTVTLSYSGNGQSSGSLAPQTGNKYYNHGNASYPSFLLSTNPFTKADHYFHKWMLNGQYYAPGQSVTLQTNATASAEWYRDPFYIEDFDAVDSENNYKYKLQWKEEVANFNLSVLKPQVIETSALKASVDQTAYAYGWFEMTVPTQGCKKCRIRTFWYGWVNPDNPPFQGDAKLKLLQTTPDGIQDNKPNIYYNDYYYIDCSNVSSVWIRINNVNAMADPSLRQKIGFNEIYFYNLDSELPPPNPGDPGQSNQS